ncbi:MAG: hypothetical protein RLN62_06390 [Rickettsiales bacterium]
MANITKIIFTLFFSALSLYSWASVEKANSCLKLIHMAHLDENLNPSIKTIKKALGDPSDIHPIREMQYRWNHFYVLTRNGKVVQTHGIIPKRLEEQYAHHKSMNIREILSTLGHPDRIKHLSRKEYMWKCDNHNSYIKIVADEDGHTESYYGAYCRHPNSKLCTNFRSKGLIIIED